MARKTTPLAHDPDGPCEAQAQMLLKVLTQASAAIPFTGLPRAFQDAQGKTLPAEEGLVKYNLGEQLADQKLVDRRNTRRTMHQMGGQFGFRGNDKKK